MQIEKKCPWHKIATRELVEGIQKLFCIEDDHSKGASVHAWSTVIRLLKIIHCQPNIYIINSHGKFRT